MSLFAWIGRQFLRLFEQVGGIVVAGLISLGGVVRPAFRWVNLLVQLVRVGADSSLVVLVTAFFTGMVLALQAWIGFRKFNAESLVGAVVSLSLTRELGPVITGLMVTGRSGSAMAAELGSMRVTEQIDALESLAVNPVVYLMTPRLYAGLIALPFLTVLADLVGIAGGYFVAVVLLGMPSNVYMKSIARYVDLHDFYSGLIKACVFGTILSLFSCYMGYHSRGGAAGVGRSVTIAVVSSSMAILVVDYFLTAWLF
jgi:phospholipid/cholesterol/gamma-HCH transport system permease protein